VRALGPRQIRRVIVKEVIKEVPAREKIPKNERLRKWKAAYDALRELGIKV
jgi:hypothetical protein